MRYFDEFVSNTTAGSGNQTFFIRENAEEKSTGRLFFRLFKGGRYRYSLMFSGVIDSTFADGSFSRRNTYCDAWDIHSLSVGICGGVTQDVTLMPVTFGGRPEKHVGVGEMFFSDPVLLDAADGDYICVQITFSGRMIPYHEETLVPAFVLSDGAWRPNKLMPFPCIIGCDRSVAERVVLLGDSITQGIGTPVDSYLHWGARLADRLGDEYSVWNIGIGFARAEDAATDGAWLYKAMQGDTVVLCLGVNDVCVGMSDTEIKDSLLKTVTLLKKHVKRVIVQTLPPFDFQGDAARIWNSVNKYILTELAPKCDMVFDVTPILGKADAPESALYGGHPNAEGCALWADALYARMRLLFDKERNENEEKYGRQASQR